MPAKPKRASARRSKTLELRQFIVKLVFTKPAAGDAPESEGELVLCLQLSMTRKLDRKALAEAVRRLASKYLDNAEDIHEYWVVTVPDREGLLWFELRSPSPFNGLPSGICAQLGPGYQPREEFNEPLLSMKTDD